MVEHIKNNSPHLVTEIRRLRDFLWDDYIEQQQYRKRQQVVAIPSQ